MFENISPSNQEKEQQSMNSIYDAIDKNKSFVFNSGAGAGKTFALVESIKYVIRKNEKHLREHNQKIICITYTNVAKEEVKRRLGNTDLVLVSTIHERIWEIIKNYKKELTDIHKENLKEKIDILKEELETRHGKYQELSDDKRGMFVKLMLESKHLFYQNYNAKAVDFRNAFQITVTDFPDILSNVSEFKKTVSTIFKLNNYLECYENIKLNKKDYKSVVYNSSINRDQLHKMKISHDTLLEYGMKIFVTFDLLKQIVIDKFPYIFIDEYQDTDKKVILIMNYLDKYSHSIEHNLTVGYFGDTAQNIYNEGIGTELIDYHSNLYPIVKQFNRRSAKEVIEVINKIRNDGIAQVSIYSDCEGGSVKFYTGNQSDVEGFIEKYVNQWEVTLENQLHCFVLTNETVAKYSGFENIYNIFKQTKKYKGINYDQLNTELLSTELGKLGEIPNLLFKIVELKQIIDNENTPIVDILQKQVELNIIELRELIQIFRQNTGIKLSEYIESISNSYLNDSKGVYSKIIDTIFDLENISLMSFKNHLINRLFPDVSEDEIETANETVQKLLQINMNEYEKWYKYISNKSEGKTIYHTYHGTKGLEFNNVIIIMGNGFGKDRNYFNFFFERYMDSKMLRDNEKDKHDQIKNLLYVSCSRAIKNLRVLYTDDVVNFTGNIENIFGPINLIKQEMEGRVGSEFV